MTELIRTKSKLDAGLARLTSRASQRRWRVRLAFGRQRPGVAALTVGYDPHPAAERKINGSDARHCRSCHLCRFCPPHSSSSRRHKASHCKHPLLGKALSQHQLRTGALPVSLEELMADEGDVVPSYLQALTNHFVVAYTPISNAPENAVILTVSDLRHTAAVTRAFHVNVTR